MNKCQRSDRISLGNLDPTLPHHSIHMFCYIRNGTIDCLRMALPCYITFEYSATHCPEFSCYVILGRRRWRWWTLVVDTKVDTESSSSVEDRHLLICLPRLSIAGGQLDVRRLLRRCSVDCTLKYVKKV